MARDVSEDSTRTAAAATRAGVGCALCTQAGWDVRGLAVVYDDVCGKQAIECWMQASAQKQEVREEQRNKPGRQGEVLRSTGREERIVPWLYSPKHYHCCNSTCACEKTMAGERLAMSRCAGKHFMLAPKLGRHTTSAVKAVSDKGRANFLLPRLMPTNFSSTPRL